MPYKLESIQVREPTREQVEILPPKTWPLICIQYTEQKVTHFFFLSFNFIVLEGICLRAFPLLLSVMFCHILYLIG